MTGTNENQNEHAGRNNGKSVGRPAGVYGVQPQPQHENEPVTKFKPERKPEPQSAGKGGATKKKPAAKKKPATKKKQKKPPKKTVSIETPLGIPQDFKVPADFFDHLGDPRFKSQMEEYGESLLRTNQDFLPTANDISIAGRDDYQSSLANWHSGAARYLPVRISWLSAVAQLMVERSIQAKVECTYGPDGKLKSKKVTSGKGDSGALAVAQSLLEMEMKWAEKMKPAQNTRVVLEVPAGGDVRKHKILDLIRKKLELQKLDRDMVEDKE